MTTTAAPGPAVVYTEHHSPNGPPPWKWRRRAARDAAYKLIVDEAGVERLYDVRSGKDDGPDLLAGGALTPEARASLVRLRAEIARHE